MKRDARIGLAVILVLGLTITLLIGRALYKDSDHIAEDENIAAVAAVPYSSETRRVDGAETTTVMAAASSASVNHDVSMATDPSAKPTEINVATQKFIEDQTTHVVDAAPRRVEDTKRDASAADTFKTMPENPKVNKDKDNPLADHELRPPNKGDNEAGHPVDGYAYTIVANDNIWKISNKVYGDGKYTQKILEANNGLRADKMKVGNLIRIPIIPHKTVLMKLPSFAEANNKYATKTGECAGGSSAKAESNNSAIAAKKTAPKEELAVAAKEVKIAAPSTEATVHKIEAGETLSGIAKKYYGVSGPKTIARIIAANKGLDPAKLKIGQELTMPAKTN